MPQIDWKIDVGHVLLFISMLIGGAIGWGNLTAQMNEQSKAIAELRQEWRTGHDRLVEQTNGLRDQLDVVRMQQMQTKTQLDDRLASGKGR
jgi:hypothetical protein